MLPKEAFERKVELSTLVSYDLIISNQEGKILVGRRRNNPAKGYLFVPGGSLFKDETFVEAMERISESELGFKLSMKDVEFSGVFEHFYQNNFANENFGTHYIALAFRRPLAIDEKIDEEKFADQHDGYEWLNPLKLLDRSDVHENTKNYFRIDAKNKLKPGRYNP